MFYRLYTHNDLDGVACAILARLLWNKNVDIKYCSSPDEVTKYLNVDDNRQTDLIFITDCSFDYDTIKNKNVLLKIRLFDHHATALSLVDKSEFFVVKVNREDGHPTCGAELFYNHLKERRGFTYNCNWFIEQVRLYDTWEWVKYKSKTPKYLSMLLYTNSITHFCDSFVKKLKTLKLSELNVFSEKDRILLEYEEYKEQKEVDKAIKNCYTCEVEGLKYAILFGEYNLSNVSSAIVDYYNVDIVSNINLNNEIMGVRTTRNNIDLGKLMQERFHGGGHAKAAGTPIPDIAYETILKVFSPSSVVNFGRISDANTQHIKN